MEALKIENQRTKMIAHRGLSGIEQENTMAAFIAACNRSYFGIECDIRRTKDGVFVVFHDENTKRLSTISSSILESTLDQLQEIRLFDLDSKEEKEHLRIPTLKDYLLLCKKYKKTSVIELKTEYTDEEILEFLQEIKQYYSLDSVIIISFSFENLKKIRKMHKDVRLQYLVSEYSKDICNQCRKIDCDIDIHYSALTKDAVEEMHYYGIKVNVWTVDNPIVALMFVVWDVDYITSNILE